jgi:exonuclease III
MLKLGLKYVKKHTTDTAAIQEIRWKRQEVSDTGKFTMMYSANDSNTFGTSLLINKKYKKAIMYFEVVDERLCSLRTKRAFNNFTII